MFRRMLKTIIITGTFVIGALVAINGAMAEDACEAPEVLYLPTPENWEWKVTLESLTPLADGTFEYAYSVEEPGGTTSGLDFLALTIPDCCPEAVTITPYVPNKTKIFAVGEGEPTTDFGVGNYQAYVVKYTPSPKAVAMQFKANSGKAGKSSVRLKAGKKLFGGEIRGLACPGYAQKAVTVSKKVITEDGLAEFCIEADPYSLCGIKVLDCKTGDLLPSKALGEIFSDDQQQEPVTEILNPDGAGCPSFTIKSGQNSYWYYCTGGRCYYYYY